MNSIKAYYRQLDIYKKGIWLYIILIFLQEVMRKWFMPGIQQLWMISREPIVIWFVLSAMQKHWIQSKVAITFMVVACIAFLFTMTFGHGNLFIAIWGFRIWFFHIPFIFAAAHILDKRDLMWILRFLLLMFVISLPLIFMQTHTAHGSFWNRGAGGGEFESNITFDSGMMRPPGLFSHMIGASYYNPIMFAVFLAYYFSKRYKPLLPKKYFALFLLSMVYVIATSVSRGLVYTCLFTFFFVILVYQSAGSKKNYSKVLGVVVLTIIVYYVLQATSFGHELLAPITKRFEDAANSEEATTGGGILVNRILYPFLWFARPNYTTLDWELTPFGYGLGLSSNFAAQTMSGEFGFILGEWSSQQVTGEMGIILGTIVFFLRVGFMVYLLPACTKAIKQRDDSLPLCLWVYAFSAYGNGNINLTMTLGLICLTMILLLVALKPDPIPHHRDMQEPQQPVHRFRPFELNRLTGIRSSGDRR